MAPSKLRYHLARDRRDSRDFLYSLEPHHLRKPLPSRVDLRSHCPRIQDQGSLGTCTAHAVAGAYGYEQRVQKLRVINPSRLFINYNELALTNQTKKRKPTVRLRDALKAVAKKGVCPESVWKYRDNPSLLLKQPPKKAFDAASKRRVFEYHRIPIESMKPEVFLKHLKRCLADRCPVVFGFELYESFKTDKVKKTGIVPIPDRKHDKFDTGHAVMAVGYDDRRKAVLFRNSWGTDWGMKGYFWMPYKMISDPKFTHDFWTIRGVTG